MGTRCRIGIRNADDSVDSIYCHWDGYPEYNGKILVEHYQDEAKIRDLIGLGNLSTLGEEIGQQHPFDVHAFPGGYEEHKRMYGHMCMASGRDRGLKDQDAIHSDNVEEYLAIKSGAEYYYIWHYGRWMVQCVYEDDAGTWQLVHEVLGVDAQGKAIAPVIKPINQAGSHRTGTLSGTNAAEITKILGFKSNIADDPSKVRYSWGFEVDGKRCGIWDYKGSYRIGEFSTYGDPAVLAKIFGNRYTSD